MKKAHKRTGRAGSSGIHDEGSGHPHKADSIAKFSVESADAFQVVDQIVALREALSAMEKRPFSAASRAPDALRRLLEILENLNLRLADLEAIE
jgi:hypothetical protein